MPPQYLTVFGTEFPCKQNGFPENKQAEQENGFVLERLQVPNSPQIYHPTFFVKCKGKKYKFYVQTKQKIRENLRNQAFPENAFLFFYCGGLWKTVE